ncbi:hypothetical protein SOVF_207310 [Spinacia oleracea]|nr:hypothetical protein SOVF_207310 [Spinacia oleracea]
MATLFSYILQDTVSYAVDSHSKYFPQLEHLSWKMQLYHGFLQLDAHCVEGLITRMP